MKPAIAEAPAFRRKLAQPHAQAGIIGPRGTVALDALCKLWRDAPPPIVSTAQIVHSTALSLHYRYAGKEDSVKIGPYTNPPIERLLGLPKSAAR